MFALDIDEYISHPLVLWSADMKRKMGYGAAVMRHRHTALLRCEPGQQYSAQAINGGS